jgi:hypothetical protein
MSSVAKPQPERSRNRGENAESQNQNGEPILNPEFRMHKPEWPMRDVGLVTSFGFLIAGLCIGIRFGTLH